MKENLEVVMTKNGSGNMPERSKVIASLRRMSMYFKSMMAVGPQEDIEVYQANRGTVKMAIELLEHQPQVVYCKGCKYKSHHYDRFDNQYVCRKNMDKWGKIPEQDLKGHAAFWFCADGEKEKTP